MDPFSVAMGWASMSVRALSLGSTAPRFARLSGSLASLCLCLAVGCVDDGGLDEGSEEAETGESGEEDGDPLGLGECPELSAMDPAALPVAGWEDLQDPDLACALRALDALVAERSIVCLGENGHGVADSNLWHALVIRYLVHAHGARVVATESLRATTAPWNDYVQGGDPSLLEAGFEGLLNSLANTEENAAFVESMRTIGEELPEGETLKLTGYDVAVQPILARAAILEFLLDAAPELHDTWAEQLPTGKEGDEVVIDWLAAGDFADELLALLEDNAADYIAATDEQRHADAMVDAADLADGYRFLHWYRQDNFNVGNATYREPGMIRNVERMRAELPEDELLILVSHNRHCAREWIIGTDEQGQDSPALGNHLDKVFGDDYLLIAQAYEQGSYTRRTDGEFETVAFSANPAYLESVIGGATEEDVLLIDDLPGGIWEMWSQSPLDVSANFDALLWIRDVVGTTIRE